MEWLFAIVVVAVLGAVAVVASGRGESMSRAENDAPPSGLPEEGPLQSQDLRRVRFPLAVRGYRMADVDSLLARVAEQWEQQEPPEPPGPPSEDGTAR